MCVQTVRDKVLENAALLKELWEERRSLKQVQNSLQRERDQAKALQLEYDQFRHQVQHATQISLVSALICIEVTQTMSMSGAQSALCLSTDKSGAR